MACDRAMRQASRASRAAGMTVTAGRVAFESGVAVARAVRAGWRAERLVDGKLLASSIPTQLGLLVMAGTAGASLGYSLLQAALALQQHRAQRWNHEQYNQQELWGGNDGEKPSRISQPYAVLRMAGNSTLH